MVTELRPDTQHNSYIWSALLCCWSGSFCVQHYFYFPSQPSWSDLISVGSLGSPSCVSYVNSDYVTLSPAHWLSNAGLEWEYNSNLFFGFSELRNDCYILFNPKISGRGIKLKFLLILSMIHHCHHSTVAHLWSVFFQLFKMTYPQWLALCSIPPGIILIVVIKLSSCF